MERITIETAEHGFNVSQGDKNAEVGWDEMIGLIASLTMPEKRPCLQWMETEEQRTAKRVQWSKPHDIEIVPLEEVEKTFVCESCKKTLPMSERGGYTLCKDCLPF